MKQFLAFFMRALDTENTVFRVHTAEAQQILLHWDAFDVADK
jgi:hypothetical protein